MSCSRIKLSYGLHAPSVETPQNILAPNGVLLNILSFLPFHEVANQSVISKTWNKRTKEYFNTSTVRNALKIPKEDDSKEYLKKYGVPTLKMALAKLRADIERQDLDEPQTYHVDMPLDPECRIKATVGPRESMNLSQPKTMVVTTRERAANQEHFHTVKEFRSSLLQILNQVRSLALMAPMSEEHEKRFLETHGQTRFHTNHFRADIDYIFPPRAAIPVTALLDMLKPLRCKKNPQLPENLEGEEIVNKLRDCMSVEDYAILQGVQSSFMTIIYAIETMGPDLGLLDGILLSLGDRLGPAIEEAPPAIEEEAPVPAAPAAIEPALPAASRDHHISLREGVEVFLFAAFVCIVLRNVSNYFLSYL